MSTNYSKENIISRIAERVDFSYDSKRNTDMTGTYFAGEGSGTGPYHEETKLYVAKKGSKYFFIEEDTAPMAGHFKWIILKVSASEINDDEELKLLCEEIKKRRFQ